LFDHRQWQPKSLSDFDDRNTPKNIPTVTALIAAAAPALDQALCLVKMNG
jgi:hypothetical protein